MFYAQKNNFKAFVKDELPANDLKLNETASGEITENEVLNITPF